MAFALICRGAVYQDMQNDDEDDGVTSWTSSHHLVKHFAPKVKTNLRTNESMRQEFVNILLFIAKSLQARLPPTTDNFLSIQRDVDERLPCSRTFLQRRGTAHAVLQICFDRAVSEDL